MVRASHGVGVWKELRKGWELVVGKMVFVVGNGSRVLSWKDKWCRSMDLCDAFLNLFVIACHDPIWGIVTGAREWEGVRPPKPVASLTEILIPTIIRSPDNISAYIYNMLRCQTSIRNINRER